MSVEVTKGQTYARRSRVEMGRGGGIDLAQTEESVKPLNVGGGDGDTVSVIYGGGLVLTNVSILPLFWGDYWNHPPTISISTIEEAFSAIVQGPYMAGLAQYRGIQRGSLVVGQTIIPGNPPNGFTDDDVIGQIKELLDGGIIPLPDTVESQTFYVVIMPANIHFQNPNERGKHKVFFYQDMDHPELSQNIHFAWLTNDGTLDYLTRTFSHELVETCTDPEGDGFQVAPADPSIWNEIADNASSCHDDEVRIDGFLVQKYWSEKDGRCIAPDNDIIGLMNKVTLQEESEVGPALASHNGRLFLAWRGTDDTLNVMFSENNGQTFTGKHVSSETTDDSPALVSHNGQLFIAWRGSGNKALSVAKVGLIPDGFGSVTITGIIEKVVLPERSDVGPVLASHDHRLFIAWKGVSNDLLNLMLSEDNGATFVQHKITGQTSDFSPSLASKVFGNLYIAWTGQDNKDPNLAKVSIFTVSSGHIGIEDLEDQSILNEDSETGTTVEVNGNLVFLSWKGSGNDNINITYSKNEGASVVQKHVSPEKTNAKQAMVLHNGKMFMAWKGNENEFLTVALLDRYGSP